MNKIEYEGYVTTKKREIKQKREKSTREKQETRTIVNHGEEDRELVGNSEKNSLNHSAGSSVEAQLKILFLQFTPRKGYYSKVRAFGQRCMLLLNY